MRVCAVQVLDLSWNGIGQHEECLPTLCRWLSLNTSLSHLSLAFNRFSDAGCTTLATALLSNSTLRCVRVWLQLCLRARFRLSVSCGVCACVCDHGFPPSGHAGDFISPATRTAWTRRALWFPALCPLFTAPRHRRRTAA